MHSRLASSLSRAARNPRAHSCFNTPDLHEHTSVKARGFLQSPQARLFHVHEYQGHKLLKQYGIPVPAGGVAKTPDEALGIAEALNSHDLVVKAQVLAGGRGLGHFDTGFKGGVHLCETPAEVKTISAEMLGHKLITKQTGQEGRSVNHVLICNRYFIRREAYFAVLMDRKSGGPVVVCSPKGGVDIEAIARDHPTAIFKYPVPLQEGVSPELADKMAHDLGFREPHVQQQAAKIITQLYAFFIEYDATLVEINPLVETADEKVICLDAKLNFDPNAEFRQPELSSMHDPAQEDPREVEAAKYGLNYIPLDGNIGCLVNGAGLAMATMDLIKLHGGEPANFLDVGGGATQQQVTAAIKLLQSDSKVKAILVNIFGGIMRCDVIAMGIIAAAHELQLAVPLVVRLQGTNVAEAKKLFEDSGLRMLAVDDLDKAAQKAVSVANIMKLAETAEVKVDFALPI